MNKKTQKDQKDQKEKVTAVNSEHLKFRTDAFQTRDPCATQSGLLPILMVIYCANT